MSTKGTLGGRYLRQDGTVGYRRSVRINGKKIEKKFSRKQDADRWYLEQRREKEVLEAGLQVEAEELTVSEFSRRWLEKRKGNGKPRSSWESDEQRLRLYILPFLGDRPIGRISTREWEDLLDGLVSKQKIAPSTRNRVRSVASKMYNDAMRLQSVRDNPIRIIPKLKESMDAWDYWHSIEEVLCYLSAAESECAAFRAFAYLALNTGARVGEILALQWRDVNLTHQRMHLAKIFEQTSQSVCERTKAHTARWLGLNEDLTRNLVEYKRVCFSSGPTDFLIVDQQGKIICEHKIRRMHRRVCKLAKVKCIRIHDLRHTYASHYVMNGGGIAELMSLLGHSTPMMTQKYAHLAPGFLESKAKVVSFSPQKGKIVALVK